MMKFLGVLGEIRPGYTNVIDKQNRGFSISAGIGMT